MGPRAAVASLLACGVQLTVARFAHDPDGKKAHSHKFLSFCGDDGTAGGMYTISCEFNAQTNWPDMVDAFTYLTYPVCSKGMPASFDTVTGSFTACAALSMVSQTANNKGEVTRDPMKFPLKTTDPTGMDVYQPVIVPVGEPETNPHHLVWPEGRQPSVAQLAVAPPEADGAAREKIKLLRNLAITHGTGANRTPAHAFTTSRKNPLPPPLAARPPTPPSLTHSPHQTHYVRASPEPPCSSLVHAPRHP